MTKDSLRFVIIGGSDAGIAAALRARQVDPSMTPTLLLADEYPNFSICGLPFYLSGETPRWQQLAHRTEFPGIDIRTRHTARSIDPANQTVVLSRGGGEEVIPYDRLLIATGARPFVPPIEGLSLPGVYFLHSMEDAFRVQQHMEARSPESAVIVGSGYIGLEMADAFVIRGVEVTVMERLPSVLPTVDPDFGAAVQAELVAKGVRVECSARVQAIEPEGDLLRVRSSAGDVTAGIVLVATGVVPNSEIGKQAGVEAGINGALCVGRGMQTNVPNVYAAGDCVETWHRVLNSFTYLPLGTTAHKQGRVAGENATGGQREFEGSLGTQVVKVFDLVIARTGLRDDEARKAGFDPVTVASEQFDHKAYYPGARKLRIRVTGDRNTGRLLGAQILGPWGAEVSKRVDVFATALYHSMTVEAINDLDLSYTPPLGSPWDAVQLASQAWNERKQSV